MNDRQSGCEYRIVYGKDFLKDLKQILKGGDRGLKKRVEVVLHELQKDPHTNRSHMDIKLISSRKEGVYRVRIGKYRLVYEVDDESKCIAVTMIFHRGKGY